MGFISALRQLSWYYYYYYYGSTAVCCALASLSVSWSYTQSVGLFGRSISPSQGSYLHTGQHKHIHTSMSRMEFEHTNPRLWVGGDGSCLTLRGLYDQQLPGQYLDQAIMISFQTPCNSSFINRSPSDVLQTSCWQQLGTSCKINLCISRFSASSIICFLPCLPYILQSVCHIP
jgi:hypothetical protein